MTTAVIDATFDSYAASDGTEDETGTAILVGAAVDGVTQRSQLYHPTTGITAGSTVTDTDLQFNVTVENIEAGEGVNVRGYNTNGSDDPNADTAADKYARSILGTIMVGIDCSSTGSKTGDLGATGDAIVEAQIGSFVSFGLAHLNQDAEERISIESIENAGSDPATLTVVYTEPAGGTTHPGWYGQRGGFW